MMPYEIAELQYLHLLCYFCFRVCRIPVMFQVPYQQI